MTNEEFLQSVLSYNPDTGVFVWVKNRGTKKTKGMVAGFLDKDGYTLIRVNGKAHRAGRLAWLFVYGGWPSGEIDHINRVRSDDRIKNLRDVPHAENMKNRSDPKPNRLYPSGVGFRGDGTRTKPWFAKVRFNGAAHWLGSFSSLEEAASACEQFRASRIDRV